MIPPPTELERACYESHLATLGGTPYPNITLEEWHAHTPAERAYFNKLRYYHYVRDFKRYFLPSWLQRKMKPSDRLEALAERYAQLCHNATACVASSLNKREAQVGFWLLAEECVEPKHHNAIMKFCNEIH